MQEDQVVDAFEGSLIGQLRHLASPPAALLLAVSGGPDSMALLAACARVGPKVGLTLEVATVDHGLRPEAAAEVELVRSQAAQRGLPFHGVKVEVAPGPGLEARARTARYDALEALRLARRLDWVATGHTASDQAETVLMRLGRGASLKGAGGIQASRADRIVRPLLFALRAQVEAYLAGVGVPSAQDPMNADRAFLRVRVRTELLPLVETVLGPGATRALARFAGFAAEDDALLDQRAEAALARLQDADGALDAVGLAALEGPVQRRVIAKVLRGAGVAVDAAVVEEARAAVRERRTGTLPGDLLWICQDGQVRLEPAPPRSLHGTSRSGDEHPPR